MWKGFIAVLLTTALLSNSAAAEPTAHDSQKTGSGAAPSKSPTFTKDIAPIVWNRCAPCHRPGQVAPFSLLTYADLKKRAAQIAEVTRKRIMPPWPPEPGSGHFENERRLTDAELATLQTWCAEGAVEGNPGDLPAAPKWSDEWFLGKPDLIVAMPQSFAVAADGEDIYRNFVIPIPIAERRFVRALELRPDNPKVVHHGFMFVDETGQSRPLDGKPAQPGAPYGTKMPEGQFLSYQPGRVPTVAPDGLAWVLEKGSYLVLQLHLRPTGKPETLRASVGFYFTPKAPSNTPFKVGLTSYTIDIPAGHTNYVVKDSFVLPVDVQAIAILPHAHYLAKEIKGFAALSNGTAIPLLHVKRWDFDWQGAYIYAEPVALPKGATLQMEFTYDNSTNNVRNPNHPPKAVTYGPQSSDEMAELWLQLVTHDARDRALLSQAYAAKNDRVYLERSEYLLSKNPNDAKGHFTRALVLLNQRKTADALKHFNLAIAADPNYREAYFTLGVVHLMNRNLRGAEEAFKNVIRIDPNDYRAQGSLGNVYLQRGKIDEAIAQFQTALRINPNDTTAKENLERIQKATGKPIRAEN